MIAGLVTVLAAFVAILVTVIVMTFRERRLGRAAAGDVAAQAASDARVMAIIFGAIPCGMILTVVTAWLVFT